MSDIKSKVEQLITKAADAKESNDAVKFAQAALNAAQAMHVLNDMANQSANKT